MIVENTTQNYHDDLLWRQLKTIPAFRALLRAVESRFYRQIDLPGPVLDVGCGDGHFAQMTFDKKLTVGIDPWWGPLNKAKRSEMYEAVLQGMGDKMPFPDASFSSAISNSVLEHIPDIQPVLNEISRVLKPGGKLVITMPSHLFTQNLRGAALLRPFGLSAHYQKFFNLISRHAHTDSAEVWTARLAQAGFAVEQWQYYFSTGALRALEWGHVQGLPSAVMHSLTGRWILGPYASNLWPTERWVRPFYEEPFPDEGAYVIFVARKVANEPIQATLPEKRPFSNQESALPKPTEETNEWQAAAENRLFEPASSALLPPSSLSPPHASSPPPVPSPFTPFLSLGFLFLSLLCAVIGQSILSSSAQEPAGGLRWFAYSLVGFLAAAWLRRSAESPPLFTWQLPRLADIPRQRWFYVVGFLASLFAYRQVANPAAQHPTLALLFWFIGIGLSWYALNDSLPRPSLFASPSSLFASRTSLLTALGLFAVALVVRFVGFTSHPFILNGTEASIGLDVLNVSRGLLNNPFGTGWLTNPTLPYYLMQIPLRIFGPTVLGIRFLSPIMGALTVVAVYWVGKKLWSREVGLISAVLLLGSHLHLQYSRLGVTNIWDPLATLLALGLLAVAWERGKEVSSEQWAVNSRQRWLVAGTAVGLNAYLYTSSHLLPIMLIILLGWVLLFDRPTFYQQARHIFAAALLAIVIILPQWLYYNNNPTVFMERANNLGILDNQSGWLTAESQRLAIPTGDILRQQLFKAALAFNYSLDTSPSYRPGVPLLTFGPSVLLIIGLMVALFHLRQLRYQLLLVWFIVTIIFGGVLLIEPPSSHRLVILAPAVALLGAVALVEVGKWVAEVAGGRERGEKSEGRGEKGAAKGVLVVLVVMAVLFSLNEAVFYFGRYRTQHTFADRNTEIADELSDYLNNLGGEWTAYFFGPPSMYVGFPTIPFLVQDFQAGVNLFDVNAPGEKLPVASNPNQVFIFLPERSGELTEVKTAYPGGTERAVSGFYANPLFVVYEVEP